jgi:hypothetical protein
VDHGFPGIATRARTPTDEGNTMIDQDLAAIKAALEAGPTPAELAPTLKDGDKFTVAGLRRRPDGTYTKRCKPGNETVFTAREAKPAAALCAACVTPIVCTRDQRCMTANA